VKYSTVLNVFFCSISVQKFQIKIQYFGGIEDRQRSFTIENENK